MPILNFIETFFFISLGISFILIVLLVYHFKSRIIALETKTDTMFEIINNIVKEVTVIKNSAISQQMSSNPLMNAGALFQRYRDLASKMNPGNPVAVEKKEDEDKDEDEDSEDEDEDSEDEDEDDDSEDEDDQKIVVSDDENENDKFESELNSELLSDVIDDTKIINIDITTEKIEESNIDLFIQKSEDYNKSSSDKEQLQKMSLSSLKTLAVSKSLCTESSKLKKNELIKLLENA